MSCVNKKFIISKFQETYQQHGLTALEMTNFFLDIFIQAIKDRKRIEIRGFGSFSPYRTKKKLGRNPKINNGAVIKIPPKNRVKFSLSKQLKEHLDGKRK